MNAQPALSLQIVRVVLARSLERERCAVCIRERARVRRRPRKGLARVAESVKSWFGAQS